MEHWEGGVYILAVQLLLVALLNLFTIRHQNYFLGVLLLIYVDTLRNGVISSHIESDFFLVCIGNLHINFMLGPAVYLYIRSLMYEVPSRDILKIIALPLLIIVTVWMYGIMMHFDMLPYVGNIYLYETKFLVILIYLTLTLLIIYRDERWQYVKSPKRYRLFTFIFGGFLLISSVSILLYKHQIAPALLSYIAILDQVLYLLMYLYLIYYGMTELSWLKHMIVRSNATLSATSPNDLNMIADRIHELIQVEKIHTQPELSMTTFAEQADMSVRHLREYLDLKAHQSYYEFINEKRVEEFKSKVNDPAYSHLDLMGIAHASGFNSKATFYRAFKKNRRCHSQSV